MSGTPQKPKFSIGQLAWSWAVVGGFVFFILAGGMTFMTSGHPILADIFYLLGTVLFLGKFLTWEENKQQATNDRRKAFGMGIGATILVTAFSIWGNHRLNPSPAPKSNAIQQESPTSESHGTRNEAEAGTQRHSTEDSVPEKQKQEAKNGQLGLPKSTFLGIYKPTETLVIPPNSHAIISPGPVSPKDMADLDRMQKEAIQAEVHLKKDPDKLVLHDLFLTDFSSGENLDTNRSGFTLRNDKTGSFTHIEYIVVRQLETGNKFLMFYVLYTNETQHICESLADKYKVALEGFLEGRVDTQKTPGDSEQTSSQDLVFSNRIFIYHETYLSPEQIIAVRDAYKRRGITVILRSTDYLANKKLEAKVKQLEKRR